MPIRSFALVVGILSMAAAAEARSVPLERAAEAGVAVEAFSPNGGYSRVTLTLRNRSEDPVSIAALPGTILDNRAESEQDLTFGGPVTLSVGPGQSVTREVATFCLNQERHSPSAGARFDVLSTPDQSLGAFIGSRHPDQGDLWSYMRDRGRVSTPPPQAARLNCTGPQNGFQVCVNPEATSTHPGAPAIAPVAPSATPIPIIEVPNPVVQPPPQAPVIRRHRPRPRPHAPPVALDPHPQVNQGVTIEQD